LDRGEPLLDRRRLELAQGTHLRRGGHDPRLVPGGGAQLLGARQVAVPVEQAQHEVALRLRQWGVEPDRPGRRCVAPGDVDDVAAGGPGQVGVVEHDPLGAGGQRLVEGGGDVGQRAASLVAVEPHGALGVEGAGHPGLARPGDADEHDRLGLRRRRAGRRRSAGNRCHGLAAVQRPVERRPVSGVQLQPGGANGGAGSLRSACAGDGDDGGGQGDQPRQRHLGR
jgi:hypothetical protein